MSDTGPLTSDAPRVDTGCPASEEVSMTDAPLDRYFAVRHAVLLHPVDGDTADVYMPDTKENVTVRFLHVNTEESHGAPEVVTEFGIDTAAAVRTMLFAADSLEIAFERDSRNPDQVHLDPYDRALGLVFADGLLLQKRLVREGWSAYYTAFGCADEPIHSSLLYSEAEARAQGLGIWQRGHATDYEQVLDMWIRGTCRPNPYERAYCR